MQINKLIAFLLVLVFTQTLFAQEYFYSVRISATKNAKYAKKTLDVVEKYLSKNAKISELESKMFFHPKIVKSGSYNVVVVEPFEKKDAAYTDVLQYVKKKYKTAYTKKVKEAFSFKKPTPIQIVVPKELPKELNATQELNTTLELNVTKEIPLVKDINITLVEQNATQEFKKVQEVNTTQELNTTNEQNSSVVVVEDKPTLKLLPKKRVIKKSHELLEGQSKANTILEVKLFNAIVEDDIYFTFIKTDSNGTYKLMEDDIKFPYLKDGNIKVIVKENDENASSKSESFDVLLDTGLYLTMELSDNADNNVFVNLSEAKNIKISIATETNIKNIELKISDDFNNSIKIDEQKILLNTDGTFVLDNFDISKFRDGNISFELNATDILGNKNYVKKVLVKDTLTKKVILEKRIKNNNLSNVVNKKILVASGKAEPFSEIFIRLYQDDKKATKIEKVISDKSGYWELLGGDLDISIFKKGKIKVSIYQIDRAKNVGEKSFYTFKKFKKPIFPITPLAIDPVKYQLVYTLHNFSDEIRAITLTDTKMFIGSYGVLKVFQKRPIKYLKEVSFSTNTWVNDIKVIQNKVIVALSNGNIKVFREKDLKLLKTIKTKRLSILHLLLEDNKILSASSDGKIDMFDLESYKHIHTFVSHQWDVGALVVNDGLLYSGSDDYSIKIWDLKKRTLLKTIKSAHTGMINALLIYDGKLISASDDKTIIIRDLKTYNILRVLKGHKKAVNTLGITNNFLVSTSSDRSIILWNLQTGEILKRLRGHSKRVKALAVNDENIITGSRDYKVKIWGYDDSRESLDEDDETLKPIFSLVKSLSIAKHPITSLTQSANNIVIAEYGKISFYDIVTYDYVKAYSTLDEIKLPSVKKRDTDEEEMEEEDEEIEIPLTLQPINDIEIVGGELIAALNDSTLKFWNLETDKSVGFLRPSELATTSIAYDALHLFAGSKKGTVTIYDVESKELLNLLEGHQFNVNTVAVYNEEKVISAGDDYSIKIRDIESGDLLLEIKNAHNGVIHKIVLYEDKMISASEDGTIKVRDIETGKLLKTLYGHTQGVLSLAVDEKYLISASKDTTLKVWSLQDYSLVSTMNAHTGSVNDVMITDDYIISVSDDKTLKVWKYYE